MYVVFCILTLKPVDLPPDHVSSTQTPPRRRHRIRAVRNIWTSVLTPVALSQTRPSPPLSPMVNKLLPPVYVVRREVMFSFCSPFVGGGGVPTFWAGGWEGTYLPRSGWRGGVPTFPGLDGGYLPSQVWMGDTYLPRSGWGGGGTYLPRSGQGGGYLPRVPPTT